MTTETRKLQAGPELDGAVAKLLGWQHYPEAVGYQWVDPATDADVFAPPPYSTDLTAAWSVVQELRGRGYSFRLTEVPHHSSQQRAPVAAFRLGVLWPKAGDPDTFADEGMSGPAEAICRAALLALSLVTL